jgi:hypothetical protein
MSQLLEVLQRDLLHLQEKLPEHAPTRVRMSEKPSTLDPTTENAMQSSLHIQSTFLDVTFNRCRASLY